MTYGTAPWIFTGRALYQLQLVKSDEARKYIPDSFSLVELFGYTLGGFYLARYDDSPAGVFDELVVMAGLVWNPPTSCAWAARVFVNSKEARDHGVQHVGLPSRLATFKEAQPTDSLTTASKPQRSWWRQQRTISGKTVVLPEGSPTLHITNIDKANRLTALPLPICTLQLPAARPPTEFAGPRIRMALPSFSGATPACPQLLKYACDLWTNVRFVAPARVLSTQPVAQQDNSKGVNKGDQSSLEELCELLSGKPLLCMAFDNMEMTVQEPEVLVLTKSEKASTPKGATSLAWLGGSNKD